MQSSSLRDYSRHYNRLTISLKWLIVSSALLISITAAECRKQRHTAPNLPNSGNHSNAPNRPNAPNFPHRYNRHLEEARKNSPNVYLSSPEECLRECRTDEAPRTCYYHFTAESYPVFGAACQYCTPSKYNSISSDCQCITANGVEKMMLAVNRMFPGPSIQVCKNDKLVIDVENKIPGTQIAIHWHGIYQNGTQYFDGVPLLTQCPIIGGSTFRYQFYAGNSGTHFWHSHDGLQKMDGLTGMLIVREPKHEDLNGHLYDYDLPEHSIMISDWMFDQAIAHYPGTRRFRVGQAPDSILINGKGQARDPNTGNMTTTPSEEFIVKPGGKYRMRFCNAFCTTCTASFSIQGHLLLVFAIDGAPIKPRYFSSIQSGSGERYDFILHANQNPGVYWIHVRGLGPCTATRIQQTALLRYEGITSGPISAEPTYDQPPPPGVTLNPLDGNCAPNRIDATCIHQLEHARPVEKEMLTDEPDVKLYIDFEFITAQPSVIYQPNTEDTFLFGGGRVAAIPVVDNVTFVYPPSPPLSQRKDLPQDQFCNKNKLPAHCRTTCACTNVIKIPLGATTEVVLVDAAGIPNVTHSFHLHGQHFYVLGMGTSPDRTVKKLRAKHLRDFDLKKMIRRWKKAPPEKDVIVVPNNGYVIFRFKAINPGYWLMHCHFIYHTVPGMDIVFQVGEQKDLPPVPKGFPTCGNYIPPVTYNRYG